MSLPRLINGRTASAPYAREWLQSLLPHERGLRGHPDLLGPREDISAAVWGPILLNPEEVMVSMDGSRHFSTFEADIEGPIGDEEINCGRCYVIGDSKSDILQQGSAQRTAVWQKAAEIARSRTSAACPLTGASSPAVVTWSSAADHRPIGSRRTAYAH